MLCSYLVISAVSKAGRTAFDTDAIFSWFRPASLRVLAVLLLPVILLQPLLTNAEVVLSGTGNTALDAAPNGVTMVNIATPNSAGVSQNIYQQFDVDTQGLILNNATGITQTQLGGYIDANANLVGGSAGIILNEVISTELSRLNGYLEVGGARADVIVANPNGITCNGCGFINTNRATLTTGKALFKVGGGLDGFSVSGGSVWFEGLGLNANNIARVDVLARAVMLNAELYAQNLNLITGQQTVSYADLSLGNISTDGDAPGFAIDSSQLGGIYANRIFLLSSETGVGVNLQGSVAAISGDLNLNVNGDLSYNTLSSQQNINLKVANTLNGSADSRTEAVGRVEINADVFNLDVNSELRGDEVFVNSQEMNTAAGVVVAGNLLDVSLGQLTNEGQMLAQVLALQASNITNNNGTLFA